MVKSIGCKIDSDLHHKFSVIVSVNGTTKTKFLREAIENYVAENEKEE